MVRASLRRWIVLHSTLAGARKQAKAKIQTEMDSEGGFLRLEGNMPLWRGVQVRRLS